MKEVIQVGDVVHLKSGGPALIVMAIDSFEKVEVAWIDGNGMQVAYFPSVCLIHDTPK